MAGRAIRPITVCFRKSPEKAYAQLLGYMDRLGVGEGWLVVADSDLTKPWNEKISSEDHVQDGKTIHIIRCQFEPNGSVGDIVKSEGGEMP